MSFTNNTILVILIIFLYTIHAFIDGSKYLEGVSYVTIFTQCNRHIKIFQERLPALCSIFKYRPLQSKELWMKKVPLHLLDQLFESTLMPDLLSNHFVLGTNFASCFIYSG